MSKHFYVIALTILTVICGACSKGSPEEIHKKIQKHEVLSSSDYSVMVDYVIDAGKEMKGILNDNAGAYENEDSMSAFETQMEKFQEKYAYVQEFTKVLNMNEDKVSKSDKEKIERFENSFLNSDD